MPSSKRKTWTGRIYLGRDDDGQQQFHWVGRFDTKRERDREVAQAHIDKPWEHKPEVHMTCDELADRYIDRYERLVRDRKRKASSLGTARASLAAFRSDFGDRAPESIHPVEAEDWAQTVAPSAIPQVVALFNYATRRLRLLDHNPFDGLGGGHSNGRADQPPPTVKELQRLLDACDALGDYAPRMRDLIDFAGYTLMRPGELHELRHDDADLVTNRLDVSRRLYRGTVDVPKGGKPKTIALVPPARAILLRQPTRARDDGLVFVSKHGKRLTAPTVSGYWAQVKARANLDFDFYLATKHLGVHRLYKLGLSRRAIAAQAGWAEQAVDAMLRVYGHADLVALAEVDALYADRSDAPVTQEDPNAA